MNAVNNMRYLGSKVKMLSAIEAVIDKYKMGGSSFVDLFAGTGCVGDFFKDRFEVTANDFLYYSYVLNRAKLSYGGRPEFRSFQDEYQSDIFEWLNARTYTPDSSFFVYHNYTPHGGRMFFTDENGIKIDGIRQDIEQLYSNGCIAENEYYYLLASLIESVTHYSNTSGTYEAFFKFWDSRALKEFVIEELDMKKTDSLKPCFAVSRDANLLAREISGDIVYIDTPYTVTQYVSAYHFLETLARYDAPKIKGIGGKRDRGDKNSLYARRLEAKTQFEDLFRQINFKHVIISYSNQGLVPVDELIELAKLFAVDHVVHVETFDYREYQNHRSSNKRNGKALNEIILYFQKDMTINKSPLNYSGSKNTMMSSIVKELPYHVGTFVDAMGGAFNVGANIVATDAVFYNEINTEVYEVMKWLLSSDKKSLVRRAEDIIAHYELVKGAKEPFEMLKDDYNRDRESAKLFVLHMYSFQNMVRFNGTHQFNTPVGVAGYSEDMKKRMEGFGIKAPNLCMLNQDYTHLEWDKFPADTLFYFDPPYFITSAAYNDGKRGGKGWGLKEEEELLNTLSELNGLGYKFLLSNVINHNGKEHKLLISWAKKNRFPIIDVGTSGWRYAKKEVLIKNY